MSHGVEEGLGGLGTRVLDGTRVRRERAGALAARRARLPKGYLAHVE